jgi:hypothetical protein
MFFVRARGEVHGDCARRDLGQSRRNDDLGRGYGSGEPRGQGKRHGQTIRHSDHDVTDRLRACKMPLYVRCCRQDLPPRD